MLATFTNISVLATALKIKGGAGAIKGWYIYNNAASTRYVKIYDSLLIPTVGSATPKITMGIPAGAAANVMGSDSQGIGFDNGIWIAATQNVALADTTAPSANDIVANIYYG